jgi:hypothetical protein
MYILTSGPFTAIKFKPDSVANALAINVLLHPGGPYNKMPLGGRIPNLINASACYHIFKYHYLYTLYELTFNGHAIDSCNFCLISSCPPISSQ